MGAGQSDLYSGTYGDRIRNISKESTEGNIKDWLSKKQDADVYDSYNFTVAQKNSMTRIKNTIEHNLTEEDFSGTRRDLVFMMGNGAYETNGANGSNEANG